MKNAAIRIRDLIEHAEYLAPDEKADLIAYLGSFNCHECLNGPLDGHDNTPFCNENYESPPKRHI